jgi:hypothetical protein
VVSCNVPEDIPLELMCCRLSKKLETEAEDPEAAANANTVPVSPAVFKLDAVAALVGPLSWKLVNSSDVRVAEKRIACVLRTMVDAEALEEVDSGFVDTRAVVEVELMVDNILVDNTTEQRADDVAPSDVEYLPVLHVRHVVVPIC